MERLTRWCLASPRTTLLVLATLTLALGAGLPQLEADVGYRALLGEEHPAVTRLDAFVATFDAGYPIAAVYACEGTAPCRSVFDPGALRMAADVARRLAESPAIRRVDSVATTPLRVPGAEAMAQRRLADAASPEALETLIERALHDSLWPRVLVSQDGTTGAVVAEIASSASAQNIAAYAALEAALAPYERTGWQFARVGGAVEFVVAGDELRADTVRLVPAMVILVAVLLFGFFRSPSAAMAALATVGATVVWTLGLKGWLGWSQNSVTQALPPLLLVVGVCDGIHVLARYASLSRARPGTPRAELLALVAREVGPPCVATSLTTAAGFASFAASDLESFARFGLISAFGVLSALLLTFSLLPILARAANLHRLPAERASGSWERVLEAVVRTARHRTGAILAATGIALVLSALGAVRLQVDASFEDLYGERSRVVRWARQVSKDLRRPDSLEVAIVPDAAGRDDGARSVRITDRVASSLAEIEGLGPARSLVDLLALAHQQESGGDAFWRRLPARDADLREILSAAEQRDPDTLARWLSPRTRQLRISLEADKPPQQEMRRIFAQVDDVLARELPAGFRAEVTGPLAVVHTMVDEIRSVQLQSFALAASVTLVLVGLYLGSLSYAGLALVPTLAPVIVTLGAMGWAGANLDVGSVMVAAIVIGIAVDDSIHLLTRYRNRRAAGEARERAIEGAVLEVGRAATSTSIALVVGFFALTLSSWQTISNFGALAALAIAGALVADLLVLPALISWRPGRRESG